MEALTFTFVNGLIPVSRHEFVDFEDFEFYQNPTDRCWVEPSPYGPRVVFDQVAEEYADYLFTGPAELVVKHHDLYENYLRYLANA